MLKFLVWSYLKDHILSHGIDEDSVDLAHHPLPKDQALPGDNVDIRHGPYIGRRGTIEWITPNGKFFVHLNDSTGSGEIDEVGRNMIMVEPYNVRIELAPYMLTLTKDKGYNVTVGNAVEVSRGNWYRCWGVVKAVNFTTALLDIVCYVDGSQVSLLFALLGPSHPST